MVDPIANEASLRYMAAEITRLQLMLAQATGNLALERSKRALETPVKRRRWFRRR